MASPYCEMAWCGYLAIVGLVEITRLGKAQTLLTKQRSATSEMLVLLWTLMLLDICSL
jgi:hypothetical protein